MDIKTLEYMTVRVRKSNEIQNKINILKSMKVMIDAGKEIRIDLCGSPYQRELGYENVNSVITDLIESRITELENQFAEI